MRGNLWETHPILLQHVEDNLSSFHADAERLKGISLYTRRTIGVVVGNYGVGWHGGLWEDESGLVHRMGDFSRKEGRTGNCENEFRSGPNMTIPLHAPVKVIEYAFPAVSFCSTNVR